MAVGVSKFVFMVIRMDDHGNTALVKDGMTLAEADRLANDLAIGGHKQSYEVLGYQHSTERERLLRLRGVVGAISTGASQRRSPE